MDRIADPADAEMDKIMDCAIIKPIRMHKKFYSFSTFGVGLGLGYPELSPDRGCSTEHNILHNYPSLLALSSSYYVLVAVASIFLRVCHVACLPSPDGLIGQNPTGETRMSDFGESSVT